MASTFERHGEAPSREDWVNAFFETADKCDADLTAEWFADDIDLRFANNPAASTKADAREGLRHFLSTMSSMVHRREARVTEGDDVVQMATVIYGMADGRTVPLPVSSYLRRNDAGKIDRLWIYIDLAPLLAAPAA